MFLMAVGRATVCGASWVPSMTPKLPELVAFCCCSNLLDLRLPVADTSHFSLEAVNAKMDDLRATLNGSRGIVVGGSVAAAALAPGALTSFWVWFSLLMLSTAIALGTQKLFARPSEEETE